MTYFRFDKIKIQPKCIFRQFEQTRKLKKN